MHTPSPDAQAEIMEFRVAALATCSAPTVCRMPSAPIGPARLASPEDM